MLSLINLCFKYC